MTRRFFSCDPEVTAHHSSCRLTPILLTTSWWTIPKICLKIWWRCSKLWLRSCANSLGSVFKITPSRRLISYEHYCRWQFCAFLAAPGKVYFVKVSETRYQHLVYILQCMLNHRIHLGSGWDVLYAVLWILTQVAVLSWISALARSYWHHGIRFVSG